MQLNKQLLHRTHVIKHTLETFLHSYNLLNNKNINMNYALINSSTYIITFD